MLYSFKYRIHHKLISLRKKIKIYVQLHQKIQQRLIFILHLYVKTNANTFLYGYDKAQTIKIPYQIKWIVSFKRSAI